MFERVITRIIEDHVTLYSRFPTTENFLVGFFECLVYFVLVWAAAILVTMPLILWDSYKIKKHGN